MRDGAEFVLDMRNNARRKICNMVQNVGGLEVGCDTCRECVASLAVVNCTCLRAKTDMLSRQRTGRALKFSFLKTSRKEREE